jgi:hypothetical protein
LHPGDEEMVSGPCAGNVKQVTLGVIDLLQVAVLADVFDALLQGKNLVVAPHDSDRAKLETLGQVHGTQFSDERMSRTALASCRAEGNRPLNSAGSFDCRWYSATPIGLIFDLSENSTSTLLLPAEREPELSADEAKAVAEFENELLQMTFGNRLLLNWRNP